MHSSPTTHICTLSLHDALPIFAGTSGITSIKGNVWSDLGDSHNYYKLNGVPKPWADWVNFCKQVDGDRKSTRLNSSHRCISYAVFCLKKKKEKYRQVTTSTSTV